MLFRFDRIEIGTLKHITSIENGKVRYRKSEYKNRNNWIMPTDVELIEDMVEYIKILEETIDDLQEENYLLHNMREYINIWETFKECDCETKIYIYDSHMSGGWYATDEPQDYEYLYCETCGDSDSLIWSGTAGELYDLVRDYIQED